MARLRGPTYQCDHDAMDDPTDDDDEAAGEDARDVDSADPEAHEDGDNEITFFAPIRPTVAQSLRPYDEILVPTGEDPFPQVAYRARIINIRYDEAAGLLIVNGEFVGDMSGLFEKPAYPGEIFQRLVQPGEPAPGSESILVRGEHLWRWTGAKMNDLVAHVSSTSSGALDEFIMTRSAVKLSS